MGDPSKPFFDGLIGGCTLAGGVAGRGRNPLSVALPGGLVVDNGIRLGRPPGNPGSSTLALDGVAVGEVADPGGTAAPDGEVGGG